MYLTYKETELLDKFILKSVDMEILISKLHTIIFELRNKEK